MSVIIPPFLLASASPRRAELLAAAGFAFEVVVPSVDETPRAGEPAQAYVERIATLKAEAVARRRPGAMVLAADTTVVVDGRLLGKPAGPDEAAAMLRLLAGRTHEVLTGVVVQGRAREAAVEVSRVSVLPLDEEEIAWYVATGEPFGKAGAYAIQGRASRFVAAIAGSYTNVVGLPVATVYRLLRKTATAAP